jgi:hypothetical protein
MQTVSLYEQDFYAWTQEQARLIKQKAFEKLDITHLFDEVESMGAREKSELKSRLTILLMHLLKWKYQPEYQSKSWKATIMEQRFSIQDVLDDNPSLKSQLSEYLIRAYKHARPLAHQETGVYLKNMPEICEWTIAQILDDNFLPS